MTELTASRTLVKSAPELWSECSDPAALARHLDHFGEIRITRLEPETAVAWEGELARGTVRLEPAGWGTRVVLSAALAPAPDAQDGPAPQPAVDDVRPRGLLARLRRRFSRRRATRAAVEPPPRAPEREPEPPPAPEAETGLTAALDSLGRAHHRPFSRA